MSHLADSLSPPAYYEDEPGVDSSPEPLWEAEHGPDTASSPYRSPAPMPPEQEEKPGSPTPFRTLDVMHVYVLSLAVCFLVAQLFAWCGAR